MLVTYSDEVHCWIAFSAYAERNLPKDAGWRWDASTRRWFTSSAEKAKRLEPYFDAAARARIQQLNGYAISAIAQSKAEDADIDVPTPPGLSLLPYQRAGVAYALARKSVLIADEMGLGKTIQAIGVVNVLSGTGGNVEAHGQPAGVRVHDDGSGVARPTRCLVVCPASLRLNWQREWKRWHTGKLRAAVVTDIWPLALRGTQLLNEPVTAIMSYQGVAKWKREISGIKWDVLIVDECHALKDSTTKQSRNVLGWTPGNVSREKWIKPIVAERRIFLTGTPIVNRSGELWPLVHSLDPDGLGKDRQDFQLRYVLPPLMPNPPSNLSWEAGFKWRIDYERKIKAQRMAELHDRLRSSFMVRRLKADVLKDLPAKRRVVILVEPEGYGDVLSAERQALKKLSQQSQEKRQELARLQSAGDAAGHREAIQRLQAWRGAALSEISKIRHDTAVKKLPAVIDHLWSALEETEKIVVFAHHHDVVDGLRDAFGPACVVLDGRMNDAQKSDAVADFQGKPGVRLFVGSIRAAGLGITLTAASLVVFSELDWTPAAMVQAEDRLHRIGQRDSVLVQHLVIDGSIDQRMAAILIEKQQIIDGILDGKIPEAMSENVLDAVLAAG